MNETLTNTTTSPVTVTYVYTTTANGCINTQNVTVTVNPVPALSSTLTPTAICSGTAFNYTATSATVGAVFSWSRAFVAGISQAAGSGSSAAVSETLTNTTTSPVTVTYVYTTAANGCSSSQNVTVTVNPIPVLSSTLTPAGICSGSTFNYAATSATPGATLNWSRAMIAGITQPGATGTDGVNETLTNTTTAPITVTYVYTIAANGCTNTQNVTVTVNPVPALSSTLAPAAICSGTTFSYAPASATAGATFGWTRATVTDITPIGTTGSGNVSEILTNASASPITVTYIYTTTANGCTGTQNVTVTVNPTPVLSSTLAPAAICSATTFSYTPASATAGATFGWSRATVPNITPIGTTGSGNVSETLTNATASPIAVTYAYTIAANGCTNTQNVTVTVNPTPALSSGLAPAAICSGTTFSYTPASLTAGATFSWTRAAVAGITEAGITGAGGVSEILTNETTDPIVVTYVYTTTANGCSKTENVTVTVNPVPVLSSTLTPAAICSGSDLQLYGNKRDSGGHLRMDKGGSAGYRQRFNQARVT